MTLFLKNLLFTLVMPGAVAVYIPLWIASESPRIRGAGGVVGALLILAGASIYLWCLWDFATFGRGTPAPIDAPKHLVVRGLYRWTRNPMYVGVLTVIAGWSVLFRDTTIALFGFVVWVVFHLFVTLYEERALALRFGDEYVAYRHRVPRWLGVRKRDT